MDMLSQVWILVHDVQQVQQLRVVYFLTDILHKTSAKTIIVSFKAGVLRVSHNPMVYGLNIACDHV